MAFVLDANDPSNLGMFSKAGRFTSEKYIIFQKKDEILNNQRKFLKVTSLPHLKMEFDGKDPNRPMHDEEEEKPKATPSSKNRPKVEPFSVQVSREDFYETKKVKHPPPPCGFYNPRFDHVEKPNPTLFKYNKEKAKPQFFSTMTDFSEEEANRRLPDKLKVKIVGPTPLHQQKGRDEQQMRPMSANNPHESRFTYFEFPKNCGRSKKPLTVDMSKQKGRDFKFLYKNDDYSPDYQPNFEFGKKQLGSPGPKFEKMSPRKPLAFVSASINEDFFDTGRFETLKYRRPKTAVFNNYAPRDSDPSSPLPSFMQKTINSRFAVGTVRQKALEINNFMDGRFQTVHTGFTTTTQGFFPSKTHS